MTWADFYLICFLVGFLLSLLSFLLGHLQLHLPGLGDGGHADFGQADAGHLDSHAAQHDHVVFEILPDLLDRRVFQNRLQRRKGRRLVEMRLALGRANRQIPRLAVVPGERHSD